MKTNKLVMYGILVLAVLLIAFNFNNLTGKAVKEPTTYMAVAEDANGNAVLTNGKVKLTIYGMQGNCVDRTLSLYQEREESSRPIPLSTSIEVKKDMNGKTLPTSLCQKVEYEYGMQGSQGNFYFEAKDINTGKKIRAEFKII
jgi:hypothetical protein